MKVDDLISRSAVIDWINEQKEEVTKKQVAGADAIFTREVLVTMQRNISTFETKINNIPTAYDVDKVVEQLEEFRAELAQFGADGILTDMIEVVRAGGKE